MLSSLKNGGSFRLSITLAFLILLEYVVGNCIPVLAKSALNIGNMYRCSCFQFRTCTARAPPRETPAPQTQGPDLEDSDQAPRRNPRSESSARRTGARPACGEAENGGCVLSEDCPPRRSRGNSGEHSDRRRSGRGPAAPRPEAGAPLWPAAAARLRSAALGPGRPPHPARSPSPAV